MRNPKTRWAKFEEWFIREHYLKLTYRQIAKTLNRREEAIKRYVKRHIYQRKRRTWSDEDDNYVAHHYYRKPIKEIAATLGRSEESVKQRRATLGMPRKRG